MYLASCPAAPHPQAHKPRLKKCAGAAGRCEEFTPRPVWTAVDLTGLGSLRERAEYANNFLKRWLWFKKGWMTLSVINHSLTFYIKGFWCICRLDKTSCQKPYLLLTYRYFLAIWQSSNFIFQNVNTAVDSAWLCDRQVLPVDLSPGLCSHKAPCRFWLLRWHPWAGRVNRSHGALHHLKLPSKIYQM